MNFKNNIWYFTAQIIAIVCSIMAFLFFDKIQRGVYMFNFIMLGFIVKRLIEIKESNNYIIKRKIPQKNILIVFLFIITLLAFILFGYSINSYIFSVSIICGLFGLFILVYISRNVQDT